MANSETSGASSFASTLFGRLKEPFNAWTAIFSLVHVGKVSGLPPRLHFLRMNLRTTSGVTGIYSPFLLAVRLHMFLIRAILTQIKSHLNSELSGVSVHF
jgi:hypothetical protein